MRDFTRHGMGQLCYIHHKGASPRKCSFTLMTKKIDFWCRPISNFKIGLTFFVCTLQHRAIAHRIRNQKLYQKKFCFSIFAKVDFFRAAAKILEKSTICRIALKIHSKKKSERCKMFQISRRVKNTMAPTCCVQQSLVENAYPSVYENLV